MYKNVYTKMIHKNEIARMLKIARVYYCLEIFNYI